MKFGLSVATLLVAIAGSANAVAEWGQCGGLNYSGSTTCDAGLTCVYSNDWYSQCLRVTTTSSSSRTSSSSSSSTRISSSSSSTRVSSSSSSTRVSSSSSSSSSTRVSSTSTSSSSSSTPSTTGAVTSEAQTWKNAVIGAGGFVPGIVFNPTKKGLAYLRTDIGGVYRLNTADDSWIPLTDYAGHVDWHDWGADALATDPVDPNNLYVAVGLYTNSWDPDNGNIIKSTDQGATWSKIYTFPFKIGGNMPGRGMGERLVIDPNNNKVLFFGARSGNGLWKSTDAGVTWSKISAFPDAGTYIPNPSDSTGYNSDKVGLTWITFDPSSKTASGTSRIFVGVASLGVANVYQTTNGGTSWTALPIFNSAFIPHRGVLSPSEGSLYVSFANGAGPYDGSAGRVGKYNIAAGTWKDVTPAQAITDGTYGFGGLTVDLQKPGTVMVAALNQWWPDANIYRSLDGGSTWSPIWEWNGYPTINRYFGVDVSLSPYLSGPLGNQDVSQKLVGWMIEALAIDPFDSNHWLYGTGATVNGGRNLLNWDTVHNVTIKSYAAGIEETAVLGLISPPSGTAHLLSVVGDIGGFMHTSLSTPGKVFATPTYGTTTSIDYAGNKPSQIVRVGNVDADTNPQIALSNDYGATWFANYAAPAPSATPGYAGGNIAYSANGDTLLWSTPSKGVLRSPNQGAFSPVAALPAGAVIASDKVDGTALYAASGSNFYWSADTGATWTTVAVSGLGTANWIAVNPYKAADLWVSSTTGVFRSTNGGKTFTKLPLVTAAWRIALGAPKTAGGTPALFIAGTVNGLSTVYRSDDQSNWIRISDAQNGFGNMASVILAGDTRIYKRVYIGTNGRGIFYNSNAV
ncbi:Xyloglucanase {ECO:0000303/PubMed:15541296} Short=XG {ECO:0000303/PubMed:15541296}; AltName: Full=Cel74a {ECO:0000312/EMBL:AAP57752.1}; Flags: Precursor [Serendipita indica DSM 11827]|nr:Xyloglucanase {ECO:0000303/PubMed:15541296} Short=XG {ECO:0000303/PubMed:15541296}; AltName: Full=Cel74a {ECO:0000312/EMBL:AAP57752.1}; Flags: Precursor [Serendipita indica DSM 11827]